MTNQQSNIDDLLQQARAKRQPDTAALVPERCKAWHDVANALGKVVLSEESPNLIAGAAECLTVDGINLAQVERVTTNFLRHHLQQVFSGSRDALIETSRALQSWRLSEPFALLTTYLKNGFVSSASLELTLTQVRRNLLAHIMSEDADKSLPASEALAVAFALCGSRTDFVFSESDQETAVVERLLAKIFSEEERISEEEFLNISLVAMYRPLALYPRANEMLDACIARGNVDALLLARVHLQEPMEESSLRDSISTLSPITDDISKAVRGQYEESPFPKWHRLPVHIKALNSNPSLEEVPTLIAGCGTGRQALALAMAWPNRDITAIDLSLSSLAYGLRKSCEYGVSNIKFLHGDLLDLEASGLRFSKISSVGVIHHMKHPAAGLRALRSVMAGRHGLRIEIYTESGRRNVMAGIALRKELRLTSSPEDMRHLRTVVAELPSGHPAKSLMTYRDFYSLSEWRDLVFHVQEHRFTIKSFCKMAHGAGLYVQRLELPDAATAAFKRTYPDENVSGDIAKWHSVEMDNPGIFGSMYGFDLAKI
ncbi:MAG: methyltransferase domain-containing protein [Rhodospirillaceae bacterium]|nr:methyltransferase domain-containing protein [Rhodospirillaceae bacterium]